MVDNSAMMGNDWKSRDIISLLLKIQHVPVHIVLYYIPPICKTSSIQLRLIRTRCILFSTVLRSFHYFRVFSTYLISRKLSLLYNFVLNSS
jgi:hypothetical protein